MTLHNNATKIEELTKSLLKMGKPFSESDALIDIESLALDSSYNVAIFATNVKDYENLGNVHTAIVISNDKTDEFDLDDSIFEDLQPVGEQQVIFNNPLKGQDIIELVKNETLGFGNFLIVTGLMEATTDMNMWGDQNFDGEGKITLGGDMTGGYTEFAFSLKDDSLSIVLPNGDTVVGLGDLPFEAGISEQLTKQEQADLKGIIAAVNLFK